LQVCGCFLPAKLGVVCSFGENMEGTREVQVCGCFYGECMQGCRYGILLGGLSKN